MCGRYRLARKKEILAEVFDVGDDDDWSPRYNIAPSQSVPVVRQDATRPVRSFSLIRWGLIPFWAKDAKAGYKTINARAETIGGWATSSSGRYQLDSLFHIDSETK